MKAEGWFTNGIEGRHVLAALAVFFGVMLAANSMLVYHALDTFSGGDRPDPYRSGLRYNERIDAAARQDALGWQTDVAYDNNQGRLTLRFKDKSEEPVAGLKLDAAVSRPATDRQDRVVDFEEISQGVYVSDVMLPPGNWVLSLSSREVDGGDPKYRLKRRLFVPGQP